MFSAVLKWIRSPVGIVVVLLAIGAAGWYWTWIAGRAPAGILKAEPEPFTEENTQLPSVPADVSADTAAASTDVVQPKDLLPADPNSQWARDNNLTSLSGMRMPDLMGAAFQTGIDTIGQSHKNPNLQLRSDPVIQRVNVGPWNQPTIDADAVRVQLDIGRCAA